MNDPKETSMPQGSSAGAAGPTARALGVRTKQQVMRSLQTRIFLISWIAYAAYYFPRNAFSAAKIGILEEGVIPRETLGLLDTVYLVAYAAGQFVWGALAERYGTRVVVVGGMVLAVFAALGMGIVPAFWLFAPLMVVQGLGQSTGWSALSKNIASFFTIRSRGRAMGAFATSYGFGGLIAVPVMGWVSYSLFNSWRWAFFTGALVALVVLVLFFVFQRNNPSEIGLPDIDDTEADLTEPYTREHRSMRVQRAAKKQDEGSRFSWKELLAAVRYDPMVPLLGAVYFLLKPARYAVLLWGPVLVLDAIPELDKITAVLVPVSFGVAGMIAPLVAGWVSDTFFGARRIPPTVLSLGILFVALLLWQTVAATKSVVLLAVLLAIVGLCAFAADSMVSGVAAVDFGTSKYAAGAAGFINGCGSVGAILGGLLPGFLPGAAVFYIFAGTAAVAALILVSSWNKRPAAV